MKTAPLPNETDPVVRSSLREAIISFLVWFGALAYTVGYCARNAYNRPVDEIGYILGFPDWIWWGLVVPWFTCTLITILFATFVMSEASLGEDTDFVAGDDESNPANR